VLGHVDSGKTSICKVLSYITSTASLDKNPQSQERGITLDLGFSAFFTKMPTKLEPKADNKKYLQFTLVDCPGHASLIKTIIGGAQIIDIMFLIIDINEVKIR
jgi:selenocysteine-specific elongation factor